MIGVVVVSHSDGLARGVVEVARQMAADVPIAAAGGTEDGRVGTSLEKVIAGIEEAGTGEGVVVLYDLGSARMTAEMALEAGPDPDRLRLVDAPLVEGALAAATAAAAGGSLDTVARAAASGSGPSDAPPAAPPPGGVEGSVTLTNPLGLHARPAAAVVGALAGLDAEVTVAAGTHRASARSLLALVGLAAGGGSEITVTASGPDAREAVDRVIGLAADGFGEGDEAPVAATGDERGAAPRPGRRPEAPGRLRGAAASPGIALGPAARLRRAPIEVPDEPVADVETERRNLEQARRRAARELDRLAAGTGGDIFAAHRLILTDPELNDAVERRLGDGAGAARAWRDAVEELRSRLAALPGEVFAARAADMADVGRRVLRILLDVEDAVGVERGSVVIAGDLVPSQLPALAGQAAGVALAGGAPTAHAAIVARNLGLPMVVALGDAVEAVPDGTVVALDGAAGTVRIDPPADERAAMGARLTAEREQRAALAAAAREPGRLSDGTPVTVAANVASVAEAGAAVDQGAEGVGLLRTEFLFLDRSSVPSEDEQVAALTGICAAMEGRPVIVRTLDVGGDKNIPALALDPARHGFLGERGLRYSLAHPELFTTQLRAILRTAVDHPVSVMFPMVTTVEEVRAARAALDAAGSSLPGTGEPEQVGIMVEVPAAALAADALAAEVDFFSIGSNDLVQYTMAAERTNASVAGLYQPGHPAPLRLVEILCDTAGRAGRWVGVCGEAAADPDLAVTLVGLGVRELSMAPTAIPAVKARLRQTTLDDARSRAQPVRLAH